MFNCDCLIHPFQNDPGTSQRQRVIDELLSGAAKIDARTLADLLDYFVQLSQHINYYDTEGIVSDWQPFFRNSTPFTLASIIRSRLPELKNNYSVYNSLFDKKPVATGLQLNAHFIYYHFIRKINDWHLVLKDSGLPVLSALEILIKDKLQQPVKAFISYTNAAVRNFGVSRIDFYPLYENKVWNIDLPEMYSVDTSFGKNTKSKLKAITNLYGEFRTLFPVFTDIIAVISTEAEKNLQKSLIQEKEELQKKHEPHLALVFAFLTLFQQLQNDLNQYTRKHLDFFYKDILQFKAGGATPDKVHVLFEIQVLLKKYLLNKNLLLKGGKDILKQEILFGLTDEIVVNKTEIADKKTLFLNNHVSHTHTYVEGVYKAPKAEMADGIEKDFPDEGPKNFPTVGAKYSKYTNPETKIISTYPHARIGFILASPVLLLGEGSRNITINLACQLKNSVCGDAGLAILDANKSCCNENQANAIPGTNPYPSFVRAADVYPELLPIINNTYIYITEDLVRETVKKGFKPAFADILRAKFPVISINKENCYCDEQQRDHAVLLLKAEWDALIAPLNFDDKQKEILAELFVPFKIFKLSFSGEKEWIVPKAEDYTLSLSALNGTQFNIGVTTTLPLTVPAVTYYNKDVLLEDFNTELPLVKVELDDRIKLMVTDNKMKGLPVDAVPQSGDCSCNQAPACCVLRPESTDDKKISLYHFFRNVLLADDAVNKTLIEVKVCGLRNLLIQNDESLLDVNAPFFPFGNRPRLDSNFYIGSKEIFSKNWQEIWINTDWKDRPVNFATHYQYYDFQNFEDGTKIINESKFLMTGSVLEKATWRVNGTRRLFKEPLSASAPFCIHPALAYNQDVYHYLRGNFPLDVYKPRKPDANKLSPLNVVSEYGFLRMTLNNMSFQHDRYSYVLARYMMALANLTDPERILDANNRLTNVLGWATTIQTKIGLIIGAATSIKTAIDQINRDVTFRQNIFVPDINVDGLIVLQAELDLAILALDLVRCGAISVEIFNRVSDIGTQINNILGAIGTIQTEASDLVVKGIKELIADVINEINIIKGILVPDPTLQQGLPKEPYTPAIANFSLDYRATADIKDMDLIHLYPFDGTYKKEEATLQPSLFPVFCDEGTLYLGLNQLVPGNNLDILFQLAEATSDSESEKELVNWHYLDSNSWKPLRKGFEVLDDATENLTTSGIVKFALPANMTSDNTVMPKNLFWIKASIAKNSRAVSETTGIHPQAMLAEFTNTLENDRLRLEEPLPAGSIAKLNTADASVKSVAQPYDSFGGRVPEAEGQFYVRVSETLRHKGRAIQPWDYERLALQAFPEIFKAKCISHSFALDAHLYKNDFPYAPGYVILAVIPDLNKLKAGFSFEPRMPVSILEKIESFIRKRVSPFVRFRAMNPRFEKINFCIKVQLIRGKDENYYKEKLKDDLKKFLAPWAVGEFDKLTFGQCVYRADIIRFLETRDYIDFITDLQMGKENQTPASISKVCPDTPRSILVGGNIEVCIRQPECDQWNKGYLGCDQQVIGKCDNEPELIIDYCKPRRVN